MNEKFDLSVCVAVLNRSLMNVGDIRLTPFPNMVRSVVKSAIADGLKIEMIVTDFNSTDWPLEKA